MAEFTPRVEEQILPDLVSQVVSNTALTDINPGSVILTILQAVTSEAAEQYMQMIELVRAYSLDTIEGDDLDARASEFGLTRFAAQNATGNVTISDTSFTKISIDVSNEFPAPTSGQTVIYAEKTSSFPATGSIIVGRGTTNIETVTYSSVDNSNPFYTIFNLASGFANPHDTTESIILSQGGTRIVPSGTVVQIPASDNSDEVQFTLTSTATIFDGEDSVSDVGVSAVIAGSLGNAPANSIKEFETLPFATATVTNPLTYTNGEDEESDQQLRDRIKSTIQGLSKGTKNAIELAAIGVEFDDQRVVSASLIETIVPSGISKLYIDDGTGLVSTNIGVGLENVLLSATGGEKFLNLDNFPIFPQIYVSNRNNLINFDEGSGELTATIPVGSYTISALLEEIQTQMELVGSNSYTLTINDFEKIKIVGSGQFTILWKTGTNGFDNGLRNIGRLIGFNIGNDDENQTEFTADRQPTILELLKNKRTLTGSVTLTNGSNLMTGASAVELKVGAYVKYIDDDDSAWARIESLSPDTLSWTYEGAGGTGDVEIVEFLTTADYTLNRFVGTFELNNDLISGDQIIAGDSSLRAQVESTSAETYNLSPAVSTTNPITFTQGSNIATGTDLDLDIAVGDYVKLNADIGSALTGTPSFVNGSTSVSGVGTSFTTELEPGDLIKLDSDNNTKFARVASITNDTSLTLSGGYIGTTGIGASSKSDPWILVQAVTPTQLTFEWTYAGAGGVGASSVSSPSILSVVINGDSSQSISFLPIDFSTLGSATALEVVARITKDISGGSAIVSPQTGSDKVKILSNTFGSDGSVRVIGGSANTVLSFPVTTAIGTDGYKYYTGLLQEVQHTIDGNDAKGYEQVRAAGTQIAVVAPDVVQQTFAITITPVEGLIVDNLRPSVRSVVVGYVNSLGIGDDVILSEIIDRIQSISGVFDVSIVAPASNVSIGDDELARVSDGNISVS